MEGALSFFEEVAQIRKRKKQQQEQQAT